MEVIETSVHGRLDIEREIARENIAELWSALAMIREVVEDLAPPGSVPNQEYLEPPPMLEAEAIIRGILAIEGSGIRI